MWNYGLGHWWMFPVIVLLMVMVCTAFVLIWVSTAGNSASGRAKEDPAASALQILNERFARGEIARQEYEERKRALLTIMTPGGQT